IPFHSITVKILCSIATNYIQIIPEMNHQSNNRQLNRLATSKPAQLANVFILCCVAVLPERG
ncbi:hypothetical protein, partial [Enterobacter hormaechei]|uniref:hypothetical protein n=1 Tax=Enterobacter hormaechei TaxID=158836 RepID=UPI001CA3A058